MKQLLNFFLISILAIGVARATPAPGTPPYYTDVTNIGDTDVFYDWRGGAMWSATGLQFKTYMLGAMSTGLTVSGTTVSVAYGTTAGTALQGNAINVTVQAHSALLDQFAGLSAPSGTYVLSSTPSGSFSWIPQSGLGSMTIGSNAYGVLHFVSPTLDFVHPINAASGVLVAGSDGSLPLGLLGDYVNVSGGFQSYNAATTILGNVTTGTGTVIVLSVGGTLTNSTLSGTTTAAAINGVTLSGSGTLSPRVYSVGLTDTGTTVSVTYPLTGAPGSAAYTATSAYDAAGSTKAWSLITGTPTTLSGYGIANGQTTLTLTTTGTSGAATLTGTGGLNIPQYSGNPGTVTSIALATPSYFTVSGSPVSSSGTLTITMASTPTGTGTTFALSSSGTLSNYTFTGPTTLTGSATLNGLPLANQPTIIAGSTPLGLGYLGGVFYAICTRLGEVSPTGTLTTINPVYTGLATGTYTITSSLEYPQGTLRSFTFSGASSYTMTGTNVATADPLQVSIPPGSNYWIRTTYHDPTNTYHFPQHAYVNNWGLAGWQNLQSTGTFTDYTTTVGSISNGDPGYETIGPSQILGTVSATAGTAPSVMVIGDSIPAGTGDTGTSGHGPYNRALQGLVPFYNYSSGGQTLAYLLGNTTIPVYASNAKYAVVELGVNDVFNGTSLATMEANYVTYWTQLHNLGMSVYQTTITPETTSTDSWATTVNQTVKAQEANRVALNNWIRTCPAPLSGFFEVADTVETSRNSGIWKAPSYTADGIHPSSTGAPAEALAINPGVFYQGASAVAQAQIPAPALLTSNSTGTITFNSAGYSETIFNPSSSTISSGTLTLSGTSAPRQVDTYVTNGPVTSLTVTGGAILIGTPPTSLSAGAVVEFKCTATGTWIETR